MVEACWKVKAPGPALAVALVLLVLDYLTSTTQCELALAPVGNLIAGSSVRRGGELGRQGRHRGRDLVVSERGFGLETRVERSWGGQGRNRAGDVVTENRGE